MNKNEAAKLIANKSHAIFNDNNDYELLREILSLAFPDDDCTEDYNFYADEFDETTYCCNRNTQGQWANIGYYIAELEVINLSDIDHAYYDNSKGSIYQFCENQRLNAWEFDIIKRTVRCRKKGNFIEDMEKTKVLIDLYIKEWKNV